MRYFLAKSEPEVYSIDDLKREGRTAWTGVRNPQAVRAIREMQPGDRVLIYHSGGISAVVGLAKVLTPAQDDPKDPKSAFVDIEYVCRLDPPTGLKEVKASGLFEDFALVRQSRLSTMAVPDKFVDWLRERYPAVRW